MSQLDRRFPPLPIADGVVTHAGMTRAQQTIILVLAIFAVGAGILFFMWEPVGNCDNLFAAWKQGGPAACMDATHRRVSNGFIL